MPAPSRIEKKEERKMRTTLNLNHWLLLMRTNKFICSSLIQSSAFLCSPYVVHISQFEQTEKKIRPPKKESQRVGSWALGKWRSGKKHKWIVDTFFLDARWTVGVDPLIHTDNWRRPLRSVMVHWGIECLLLMPPKFCARIWIMSLKVAYYHHYSCYSY